MNQHEDLLESLLARDEDALAAARRDPGLAAELRELEDFVDRARDELAPDDDWSPIREARLVGRVLARTTREDLSWRGDLVLFAGYVRERLAGSVLLRVVAASLLLHIVALPMVGYLALREHREHRARLSFEPAPELPEFDEDAEPEVEPTGPVEEPSLAQLENARRRARFVLSRSGATALPHEDGLALERNLLRARSRLLAERTLTPWPDPDTPLPPEASPLARALWAELLLDAEVLAGERPGALGAALSRLAADEELQRGAVGDLTRSALGRAKAYGLWEADPGFDPSSAPLPHSAAWGASLSRAFAEASFEAVPELEAALIWAR